MVCVTSNMAQNTLETRVALYEPCKIEMTLSKTENSCFVFHGSGESFTIIQGV
jgi:hypothetical protein